MKKEEIMKTVSGTFTKVSFQMKKHSPEILIVAGVIGTVTSAVIACKATTKVGKIVEETKSDVEEIHNAVEKGVTNAGEKYTADDSKKDLTIVYAQTGVKLVKLYAPSVMLGALSLTSIVASNNILRKRNVALAAAYATVDKGFKDYRSRVIERFGAEVDRELKNNVKAKKVDVIEKDPETGKDKKVKKQQFVVSPSDISGYARFFEPVSYTHLDVYKRQHSIREWKERLMNLLVWRKNSSGKWTIFLQSIPQTVGCFQ